MNNKYFMKYDLLASLSHQRHITDTFYQHQRQSTIFLSNIEKSELIKDNEEVLDLSYVTKIKDADKPLASSVLNLRITHASTSSTL